MTANLTIDKFGPGTVGPGGTITYTLLVRNQGDTDASNIVVADTLPAGFMFVSGNASGGFIVPGAAGAGNVLTVTSGSVAAGESAIISIVGTAPQGATGAITNNAVVDPANTIDEGVNEDDNTNSLVTTIDASLGPDLRIFKNDFPDPVEPGGTVTYNLLVRNDGMTTANDILVRDTLPTGFTLVSVTTDGNFTADTTTPGIISFTGGSLASGDNSAINIVGTVQNTAGELTNIAVVDPDGQITESDETNNTETSVTTVNDPPPELQPDLGISKQSFPNSVEPGGTITYNLSVSNIGGGDANNILVRDTLPAGFTLVSTITNSGFIADTSTPGVVSFTGGSIPSGDAASLTIVGTAPASLNPLTNVAIVDPDGQITESDETNNTAEITTDIILPDLEIFKIGIPNDVEAGDTITYNLAVRNNGQATATNVTVRDTVPSAFTFVSSTPFSGFTAEPIMGNVVSFTGGSIDPGGIATFNIVGTVTSGGTFVNIAVVDPDNTIVETDETNNTATFTSNAEGPTLVFVDDDWAALTLGAPVDPDGAGTEFEDGDGTIGINAFPTIQEGEQRVASGGLVRVFAGTYDEIVGITKPVELRGPQFGVAGDDPSRDPSNAANAANEAIIGGASAVASGIQFFPGANDGFVIIDGFRLEGANTGPGEGAAIDTRDAGADTIIRNNILRDLDNDAIRNFPTVFPGLINPTSNLQIVDNLIENITDTTPGLGGGNSRAMFLQEVDGLTITGNVVRNITGGDNPGILLDTVTGEVLVEDNVLGDIASQGIQVAGIGSAGGNVIIRDNDIRNVNEGPDGNPGTGDEDITNAGIRLRDAIIMGLPGGTGALLNAGTVLVEGNRVENTLNGLVVRNPADADNVAPGAVTVTGNFFVNLVMNPGNPIPNPPDPDFSFGNLNPGTYAIINGGVGTLNAVGNSENLAGTDPLDIPDVFGSVTIV